MNRLSSKGKHLSPAREESGLCSETVALSLWAQRSGSNITCKLVGNAKSQVTPKTH